MTGAVSLVPMLNWTAYEVGWNETASIRELFRNPAPSYSGLQSDLIFSSMGSLFLFIPGLVEFLIQTSYFDLPTPLPPPKQD